MELNVEGKGEAEREKDKITLTRCVPLVRDVDIEVLRTSIALSGSFAVTKYAGVAEIA